MRRSRDVCPLILMYSLLDMTICFVQYFRQENIRRLKKIYKVHKVLPVLDKYVITIPVPRASYGERFY